MVDKQAMKLERRRIAKYLREGRINAGFPTANHASIKNRIKKSKEKIK
jgi:hypothetical protein